MSKFNEIAHLWDEKPSRVEMAKSFGELIKHCINPKNGYRLLDYGCGTGTCALYLSDNASHIYGVDASKNMLDIFRRKSQQFYNSFDFICADLETCDLSVSEIDLIISTMALHHVQDIELVLSKLCKIAKQGGHIALVDLDIEDGSFHDDGNNGVYHFGIDRQIVMDILLRNGFGNLSDQTAKTIYKNDKSYSIFLITGEKL